MARSREVRKLGCRFRHWNQIQCSPLWGGLTTISLVSCNRGRVAWGIDLGVASLVLAALMPSRPGRNQKGRFGR